jgi:hypothetical protein
LSWLPPSSSGLGHSPLTAKTGVRVPLGVLVGQIHYMDKLPDQAWPCSPVAVTSRLAKTCPDTFKQTATSWPSFGGYLGLALATDGTRHIYLHPLAEIASHRIAQNVGPEKWLRFNGHAGLPFLHLTSRRPGCKSQAAAAVKGFSRLVGTRYRTFAGSPRTAGTLRRRLRAGLRALAAIGRWRASARCRIRAACPPARR